MSTLDPHHTNGTAAADPGAARQVAAARKFLTDLKPDDGPARRRIVTDALSDLNAVIKNQDHD